MSVTSHLKDAAQRAVLSRFETTSINTSVLSLRNKIDVHLGAVVREHFMFGSYTRGTILPRKIDENSDIDYMVVFKDGVSKPQTYLDRLRRFVEATYTRSEIKQSHPTIVLELSHIKFDLVPALVALSGYNIPAPASNWIDWVPTNPNAFNATLTERNKQHGDNIKPLVRLMKYWNAQAGGVYDSYSLEQYVVNGARPQPTLGDYLYCAFDSLTLGWNGAQWRREKLDRAKQIINNARSYERQGKAIEAENEINKLIPAIA
jgi:hypothetical protein